MPLEALILLRHSHQLNLHFAKSVQKARLASQNSSPSDGGFGAGSVAQGLQSMVSVEEVQRCEKEAKSLVPQGGPKASSLHFPLVWEGGRSFCDGLLSVNHQVRL